MPTKPFTPPTSPASAALMFQVLAVLLADSESVPAPPSICPLTLPPLSRKISAPLPPIRLSISTKVNTLSTLPPSALWMLQVLEVLFAVRLSVPPPPLRVPVSEPFASTKLSLPLPPVRLAKSKKVTPATSPSFWPVIFQVLAMFSPIRVLSAPPPIRVSILMTLLPRVTLTRLVAPE